MFLALVAWVGLLAPASALDDEQQSVLDAATVWSVSRPGLELIATQDQGIVVQTDFGARFVSRDDFSFTDMGMPSVTHADSTSKSVFCEPQRLIIFDSWEKGVVFDSAPIEFGFESIVDCHILQSHLLLIGNRNGERVAVMYWIPVGITPGNEWPLEVGDPVDLSAAGPHIGLVTNSEGAQYKVLGFANEIPKLHTGTDEFIASGYLRRSGNTVEEWNTRFDYLSQTYEVPANSVHLTAGHAFTRLYVVPLAAGESTLTVFFGDGSRDEGRRTLDLPFMPDRVLSHARDYNHGVYLDSGDTIYLISDGPVLKSRSHEQFHILDDQRFAVEFWSMEPVGFVGASGNGLSGIEMKEVLIEGSGLSFRPPYMEPGTYSLEINAKQLLEFEVVGAPEFVNLEIDLQTTAQSRRVTVDCSAPIQYFPFATQSFEGTAALNETFRVVKGSTCWLRARHSIQGTYIGSWGPVVDGVVRDFLGGDFSVELNGDATFGLRPFDNEGLPVWIYPFRSGGGLTDSRQITLICWRHGEVFRMDHTVVYDQPTRLSIRHADWDRCSLEALEDENSDLTAIWRYHDFGDPASAYREFIEVPERPVWFEIGELIVHPNDDTRQFVIQQYDDFLGRSPSGQELSNWSSDLDSGKRTKTSFVTGLLTSAEYRNIADPNIRLYQAYFGRLPDAQGLRYWMGVRQGGYPMDSVSDQFTLSKEFINTYGDTSDTEFITLVYANVLGRTPDADGYAYWRSLLESGQISRGQLMIYFSESKEYATQWAARVQVVGTYIALLERIPSPDVLAVEEEKFRNGQAPSELVSRILSSTEYDLRFYDHYRGPRIENLTPIGTGNQLIAGGAARNS